ncbi:hypothetical protein TWF730_000836 [Orbilia blumenaviensis]|uniref:Valine--tRNA ligase, mitochondrial n=1 Tax=Orbilia blumenaviensis TaxID=1796055 RepID=A0AAV9VPW2_9PEZI
MSTPKASDLVDSSPSTPNYPGGAPSAEDALAEGSKPKTAKQLAAEAKKAEKAKKFLEKKAKSEALAQASQPKAKKEKKEEAPVEAYVEETPPGQKKILKPLGKAYDPIAVESAWNAWWEQEGFFKPEMKADGKPKDEGVFVITAPPPNVTGALHIGHALAVSLQDVLVRWNRMQGKTVLFLPGCDHAGISTQNVIENRLWRQNKQTRYDVGREKLVQLIWDWKQEYHGKINKVFRSMGASFDWSREAFTMQESFQKAVADTFTQLHDEGVIYRGHKLVNWCHKLNTSLSNLEVDNKQLNGRTLMTVPGYDKKIEFGVIIHFKYPIVASDEFLEVATTRIETMLGDSAIAVNPNDSRYKHLIGKRAKHPFIPDRIMPIVSDDYVDMDFGTGAVKITPAHDFNDYALGKRHSLEFINILNDDGTMNENAGPYQGMKRFDVRYKIQADLKELGLYVETKDNPMQIPLCEKSKDVIEPLLKPQWWMKMGDMAKAAIEHVKAGEVKIRPQTSENDYYRWLEGIQDWCLSRQLWWGHQPPAYHIQFEEETTYIDDEDHWVVAVTKEEAEKKAADKYPDRKFKLEQDPDVLDTWFSSGQWPYFTMGYPERTEDLKYFYPSSLMETGWDILFFWVARMIMLGLKLMGGVPFNEVYCHGLIRDSEGRKMSKSLGNVIDPLDVINGIPLKGLHDKLEGGNLDPKEVATATKYQKTAFPQGIPQCGADALRFTLISYTTGSLDINTEINVFHGYRKFCNKIFQATKFVLGNLDENFTPQTTVLSGKETLAEKWILHKLNHTAKIVNETLQSREFFKATDAVYQYWYSNLCDVYIENSKSLIQDGTPEVRESAKQTLYTAIEGALLLIHPFMPFISEELWQRLARRPGDSTPSITLAKYPVFSEELHDLESERAYELVLDVSRGVRSLMAEYMIKDEGQLFVQVDDKESLAIVEENHASIKSLCGKAVNALDIVEIGAETPKGCVALRVSGSAVVYLSVKGRVDFDQEIQKAQQKLDKAKDGLTKQEKLLNDKNYLSKANKATQEADGKKLEEFKAQIGTYEESIKAFERLKLE